MWNAGGCVDVIGHRGGCALGAENAIETIESGLAKGADGVEVDARLSADGTLVLMHDPDVDRTTGGSGRVADLTAEELRAFGVPSLADALDAVPPERLIVIELKGHPWEAGYDPEEPAARALVRLLAAGDRSRRVVVSSFNPVALRVVRENAPGIRTAVLTTAAFDLASNLAGAIDGGHEECHVPAQILEAGFVADAHRAGRRVVAWTVNDPDRVGTFAGWGVDGVITDDPAAARRALD